MFSKSNGSQTDVPIVIADDPAKEPIRLPPSLWRKVSDVLCGLAAIVAGVQFLGPALPPLVDTPGPIDLLELEPSSASSENRSSADWIELERGPLAPRWPAVLTWTGAELVVWGGQSFVSGQPLDDGAAFNPQTGRWRLLTPSPFAAPAEISWVWTDSELMIWSREGTAAAWVPLNNTWREIGDWPLPVGRVTWTGEEIVDLRAAVAFDPQSGNVRRIDSPPGVKKGSSQVWTGTQILMLADRFAYDVAKDMWWPLPETEPAGNSVAGTWTGKVAVAVDYLRSDLAVVAVAPPPATSASNFAPKLTPCFSRQECQG